MFSCTFADALGTVIVQFTGGWRPTRRSVDGNPTPAIRDPAQDRPPPIPAAHGGGGRDARPVAAAGRDRAGGETAARLPVHARRRLGRPEPGWRRAVDPARAEPSGVRRRDGGRRRGGRLGGRDRTRRCRASCASGTAVAPRRARALGARRGARTEPWTRVLLSVPRRRPREPVGRTKTTPAAGTSLGALTFAFASCQDWQAGFYSAYHRMAEEDLDVSSTWATTSTSTGSDPPAGRGTWRCPHSSAPRRRRSRSTASATPSTGPTRSSGGPSRCSRGLSRGTTTRSRTTTRATTRRACRAGHFLARRAAAYQAYYEHLPLRLSSLPQRARTRSSTGG